MDQIVKYCIKKKKIKKKTAMTFDSATGKKRAVNYGFCTVA